MLAEDGGSTADSAIDHYPLDSLDQLASVPWGTPPGELIYDLGVGAGSAGCNIHIDDDGLYWAQSHTLFRGSHDGKKTPEVIGRYARGCNRIGSDATHIYWMDGARLIRRVKTLEAEEEPITLQWDHEGGAVAVTERFAYLAMPGCPAITRLDKATLVQEFTYMTVPADGVGEAYLTVADDGTIYCSSWSRIVRVKEWGTAELLYNGGVSLQGVVVADPYLVWLDKELDPAGYSRVGRMPLAGGEAELFPLPISGDAHAPFFDAAHYKLVFSKGGWVTQFDLNTHAFSYVARDRIFDIVPWNGSMYWTIHDIYNVERRDEWGAIRRVPIAPPPIFVFPSTSGK